MFTKGLIAVAIAMSSISVCYAWPTLPSMPGVGSALGGGGNSVSAADVDSFVSQGQISSKLVSDSKLLIAMAIATKEDKDKLTNSQKQIKEGLANKDTTITDKERKLSESADAIFNASTNDTAAAARLQNLSAEQKTSVINAFYNLMLGIKQQSLQVVTGQNILKSIPSNPSLLSRASEIKTSVVDMGSNIKSQGEFMTKIPSLFKSAGIQPVLPTDASNKPKDMGNAFL